MIIDICDSCYCYEEIFLHNINTQKNHYGFSSYQFHLIFVSIRGATKSTVVLVDGKGKLLIRIVGGGTNVWVIK